MADGCCAIEISGQLPEENPHRLDRVLDEERAALVEGIAVAVPPLFRRPGVWLSWPTSQQVSQKDMHEKDISRQVLVISPKGYT